MSDLLREIEEDLKQEKVQKALKNFGPYVLGGALLLVVSLIGRQIYVGWQDSKAEASAEQWFTASQRFAVGQTEGALKAMEQLAAEGFAGNRTLAALTAAHWRQEALPEKAAELLKTAEQSADDEALAALANLRRAEIEATASLLEGEARSGRPLAPVAQLRQAMTMLENHQQDEARLQLQALSDNAAASDGLRQQAKQLLSVLATATPNQAGVSDGKPVE